MIKVKKPTIIRMPQFSCGHCSLEQQVRQTDPAHDMLYCTLLHAEDGDYGRCDVLSLPSDLKKQKELMKSYLETLGLWDENSFGMYAFLEAS